MYVGVYSAVYVAFHVTVSTVGVHPLNAYVYVPSDALVGPAGLTIFPLNVP
jgi:hypothetical protein